MKRSVLSVLTSLALLLGLCACGQPEQAAPDYIPDEAHRLVVYTSHKEEVWRPIVKEFEERTGIWVDVVYGATSELLERIVQEGKDPAADVMFGGGVETLATYRDCFTPYTCAGAEDILERFRSPDDLWTPFSALPVVLIYNTKLMAPGQLTRWEDLLSPSLRGRIAFTDPAASGSSFTALATMLSALGGDQDQVIRSFAENLDGVQLSASGTVLTAVADGDAFVGVTLEDIAMMRIAEGKDIAIVYPQDGLSCVPDGSAIIKGAPHEDNAKLFLDFTVSPGVQALLTGRFCRRAVRGDVEPPAGVPALDELPMAEYDLDQVTAQRDAILMTWAFYFGEGEP